MNVKFGIRSLSKILPFLLIFFLINPCFAVIVNPYNPCELALRAEQVGKRLVKLFNIYDRIAKKYETDSLRGLIELYQNRDLLPQNGIIHVVGPGLNFYEWVVPLMVRSDVTVIISDVTPTRILRGVLNNNSPKALHEIWSQVSTYNPLLIQYSQMTPERFLSAVRKRILFNSDVKLDYFDPYALGTRPILETQVKIPVPQADLVFSRFPLPGYFSGKGVQWNDLIKRAKPGVGIIWIYTERGPLPINGPVEKRVIF